MIKPWALPTAFEFNRFAVAKAGLLGMWDSFTQTSQSLRGGMVGRTYVVRFKDKTIRAWTCEMPGGKLEQFQVAVVGNQV